MKAKNKETNCDSCEFYDFDELSGDYFCSAGLDEDEMRLFLSKKFPGCPYYRFFDEYKSIVNKQI